MFKNIIQAVFYLIFLPRKGWGRVFATEKTTDDFQNNFLFPILGFIALSTFVGGMWIAAEGSLQLALKQTIFAVSSLFVGYFAAAYFVRKLLLRYNVAASTLAIAQPFVGHASVVLYLFFFLVPLLPAVHRLWIALFYTFYLVYVGLERIVSEMDTKKRLSLTALLSFAILLLPTAIYKLFQLFL